MPLVTAGDSDYIEHDWHTIFSSLGVLQYDTKIAAVVSFLGWCGMLATVAWLVRRSLKDAAAQPSESKTRRSRLIQGCQPDILCVLATFAVKSFLTAKYAKDEGID